MGATLVRVSLFVVGLLVLFASIGQVITGVSGGGVRVVEGVGPEAGEAIFLGKGNCYTCHAVGDEGSAIRGPNQGDSGPLGLPIGLRAHARAEERTAATGTLYDAVDYLLESLIDPNVYVVEGYKAEMPPAAQPPIALSADEVKAVVAYLLSQGGDPAQARVESSRFWPTVLAATAEGAAAEPFELYMAGDAEAGKQIFYGDDISCTRCHVVAGIGGYQGPELTAVAATRTPAFIVESIVDPGAIVASGFEQTRVVDIDWNEIIGIKVSESEDAVEILDAAGQRFVIPREQIDVIEVQPGSVMPANFSELMTVQQFHDLMAYLMTLDGTVEPGAAAVVASDDTDPEASADPGESSGDR